MRRRIVISIIIGLVAHCLIAQSLWDRAVDYYRRFGDLTPGRVEVRFTQYNGRGERISTEESLYRIRLGADGELDSTLVYARKDGDDVTQERREDPSSGTPFGGGPEGESEGGGAFSGLAKSPFDPAEQDNVQVTQTNDISRMNDEVVRRFDFVHDTGADSASVGSAWLAVDSGMPLKLELGLEDPPMFVNAFAMTQYYGTDNQARWVGTAMEFTGSGQILFFSRTIESRLQFSDHFVYTED
jgi:hypothetical protein